MTPKHPGLYPCPSKLLLSSLEFAAPRAAKFAVTAIQIAGDPNTVPHAVQEVDGPSFAVALGKFTGGRLWERRRAEAA